MATRSSSSLFLVLLLTSALFVSISSVTIPKPANAALVITLFSPATGPPGTFVSFQATAGTQTTSCSVSANSNKFFSPSYAPQCYVAADKVSISGSFKVRAPSEISAYNQLPGQTFTYTVTLTTGASETASNPFTVTQSIGFSLSSSGPWTTPMIAMETQTVYIHGWGFDPASTGCTYGGLPGGASTLTCSVNGGEMSGGFVAPVGSAPGSPYTITVTGNSGNGDGTLGDTVTIVTGAAIIVTPSTGSAGLLVTVTGIGFSLSDSNTCSVSYTVVPPASGALYSAAPTCTMTTVGSWRQAAASFTLAASATVGSVYTLRVTGSTGDFADDPVGFTPANPPALALSAAPYVAGTVITVTSATFSPLDVGACKSFTSSPAGLMSLSSCAIDSTGTLVGTFLVVSSTAPGGPTLPYTITITGNRGDSGQTTLVVSPQITVTPTSGSPAVGGSPGAAATVVTVTGTGFPANDVPCSFVPVVAGVLNYDTTGQPACTVDSHGQLTAKFKVGAGSVYLAGGYPVTVKTASYPLGIAVTSNFMVQPQIVLSPNAGADTTLVTVSGAGFDAAGGACVITPEPPAIFATEVCNQVVTGTVIGSFIVGNTITPPLLPGSYLVTVTGIGGDFAFSQFTVTGGPIVTLTASVGHTGDTVTVTGSGFSTLDNQVTFTQTAGPGAILDPPLTRTCSVSGGNIAGSCTFAVASNALGGIYTLTFTGQLQLDKTTAQFLVQSRLIASAGITATNKNGGPGLTVTLSGSGFTGPFACNTKPPLSFIPDEPFDAAAPPISCSVDASGLLTGSFVINTSPPVVTGPHTITVTDPVSGPVSDTFTVTAPSISLSPTSGTGGDTITVSGSGFSSGDASCSITPTGFMYGTPSCSVTGGIVTGSFVIDTSGVARGPRTVTVTGGLGDSAATILTVVPQIALTPNTNVRVGTTVTISGSNFDATDASLPCASVVDTPVGAISGAATCNIDANLIVSGSFVVDPLTATESSYTITVTGGGGVTAGVASATLGVMPHVVTASPASGPVGASITVTGTGFSTADTFLSTIAGTPVGLAPIACTAASGGTITCPFVVATGTTPGTYTLTLTGDIDFDVGTGSFTVEPGLQLLPTSGRAGTNVLVTGTNFAPADTGCSITSTPDGLISNPLCAVALGAMSGSFIVANGVSGPYTVNVAGTTGDTGHATFTAPGAATLTLDPIVGPSGTTVTATGINYAGTTCQITSFPSGLFTSSSCTISAGSLGAGTGFTVASTSTVGTSYTVTVTTNLGSSDSATATFQVSSGPPVTLTITPTSGSTGTIVTGTGSGFSSDTTCLLTATPASILSSPSCNILGGGNVAVGFTVASGASPGDYAILATGNTGKTAVGSFTVIPSGARTFTLTPTSGRVGTVVTLTGSNFAGTTCDLSSSPSGLLSAQSCTISGGSLTGGFTVASGSAAGGYTVTVTTDVPGDTVSASFTVPGATLHLSPSTGPAGTTVTVTGENYAGITCQLTSLPTGLFTSQVCAISAAGALTGGFTVASDAPSGTYTVTATTPSESPTAQFTVPRPTLTMSPSSGAVGTAVSISGTNFVGSTCTISSSPSGLIGSPTCLITNGNLDGGFVVATGAVPGGYTVTVTPDLFGATPASGTFTIPTAGKPTLTLSPSSGATGTAVSASGSGYSGTTCTLTASGGLFGSSACALSGGKLSGGFTVASNAVVGSYTVTVTSDVSTDTTSAVFSVTKPTTPVCIIATTTFGSEAAPAVQFLRNFRDGLVLHTSAGSAFMTVFNAWYYSFSPTVAGFISAHDPIRTPIKVILYPLLGILELSQFTYSALGAAPEFAIVVAGLIASSLIGLVYLTPFMLVSMRSITRRKRINTISMAKASLAILAASLGLLAAGELAGSFLILAVASSAIVLTCIIAVPTIIALVALHPRPR